MTAQIGRLKLGRDGERLVAELLNRLVADGARVLHDLSAGKFNVDHVLIHPTGVYVIETKTYSKPENAKAKLVFDGNTVSMFGKPMRKDAIAQVRGNANRVRELIIDATGKRCTVKPVVIYPGWYVDSSKAAHDADAWVLNPKQLRGKLAHQSTCLSHEQICGIAFQLGSYSRLQEANRS
ncbi:MAG: nuclease-related domain-containing protein [Burkholderiaceae bacterium]